MPGIQDRRFPRSLHQDEEDRGIFSCFDLMRTGDIRSLEKLNKFINSEFFQNLYFITAVKCILKEEILYIADY